MKSLSKLLACLAILLLVSCNMYKDEFDNIYSEIESIKASIETLQKAHTDGKHIASVIPIETEGGIEAWKLTFSDESSVTVTAYQDNNNPEYTVNSIVEDDKNGVIIILNINCVCKEVFIMHITDYGNDENILEKYGRNLIEEVKKEYHKYQCKGDNVGAHKYMKQIYEKYPNVENLQLMYADSCSAAHNEDKSIIDEGIEVLERLVRLSCNEEIKSKAYDKLFWLYLHKKDKVKFIFF